MQFLLKANSKVDIWMKEIEKTRQEMKRKQGKNQVSGTGTTNEKTEREPKAMLHPDPPLSVDACGASKVKVRACVCVRLSLCVCRGGADLK